MPTTATGADSRPTRTSPTSRSSSSTATQTPPFRATAASPLAGTPQSSTSSTKFVQCLLEGCLQGYSTAELYATSWGDTLELNANTRSHSHVQNFSQNSQLQGLGPTPPLLSGRSEIHGGSAGVELLSAGVVGELHHALNGSDAREEDHQGRSSDGS